MGEVVWLNVFNAELSPKRYWRGPRSPEVGKRYWRGPRSLEGGGRGTGGDRDPGRWGKRSWRGPKSREVGEEVLAGTEIPGSGEKGRLPIATLSPPQ